MATIGPSACGIPLDRRSLLKGAALAGLGAFAAGCAGAHVEPASTAATAPAAGHDGRKAPAGGAPAAARVCRCATACNRRAAAGK